MNVLKFLMVFPSLFRWNEAIELDFFQDFIDNNSRIFVECCWMEKVSFLKLNRAVFWKGTNQELYELKKLHDLYFVLDARNCPKAADVLDKMETEDLFMYPIKFLVLATIQDFRGLTLKLKNFNVLPISELTVATFSGVSVDLTQPYKTSKYSEIIWETYGNWSPGNGLRKNQILSEITSRRRSDLRGIPMNVGILLMDTPETLRHLSDFRYPECDPFAKLSFEPSRCLLEFLNINFILKCVGDFGYKNNKTGIYNGLVGQILYGETEMSVTSLLLTQERFDVVDFVHTDNKLHLRFIVTKPATSYVKNIFFVTLTPTVWISAFSLVLLTSFLTFIILNWETRSSSGKQRHQGRYSVSDVALISLEAICQQGTVAEPQSFSGRILVIIFFGAFMFLYVSYSANIVVLLQSTTELKNVRQLLDSRLQVGCEDVSYARIYVKTGHDPAFVQLYEKKIQPDHYYSLEEGVRILQEGNFAFYVSTLKAHQLILKKFTNYQVCSLQELPGFEHNVGHLAMRKRSGYRELFRVGTMRMSESGIRRRAYQRIVSKPRCFSQSANFKPVGMYDCHYVFQIWFYFNLLAVGIFFAENLLKSCRSPVIY